MPPTFPSPLSQEYQFTVRLEPETDGPADGREAERLQGDVQIQIRRLLPGASHNLTVGAVTSDGSFTVRGPQAEVELAEAWKDRIIGNGRSVTVTRSARVPASPPAPEAPSS